MGVRVVKLKIVNVLPIGPQSRGRQVWNMTAIRTALWLAILGTASGPALAGPPFVTDDPTPTDYRHFENYLYSAGTKAHDGVNGAAGLDLNYGAAPNLQLTAALPVEYDHSRNSGTLGGLGNIELAAKYRFLHQEEIGWDVAIFPRVFFPSPSAHVGERHASFLFPVWIGRSFGKWSTFGGGGYIIHRGGDAKDFAIAGWALTRQVTPHLQLGVELFHQTADTKGGDATTGIGAGLLYDLSENLHVLAYVGPGIQNAAPTNEVSWYASLLFTF